MNEVVWSAIGAGTLFGLSGGFSPGPLLVLVISETLRHGLRVGIMVAITPLLTDFPVMLVAILLLNQLTHFDLLLGGISRRSRFSAADRLAQPENRAHHSR